MKGISIICLGLSLTGLALADDKGVQKYRNYTPQQIRSLPEKQISSEVPIMYTFAAQRGLSSGSELLFGMELNRLMYPGLHDYKAAVKAFQADLGDEPTGVLTVWQIHNLQRRSELQQLSRVSFPDRFSSFKTNDYASVQGTMTLIDEKIAWPINHVRLGCYRKENYCRMDQINVVLPNDSSWGQNFLVMENDPEYFDISQWSQDNIDSKPKETVSGCRTTSVNLNFKTKEFFFITRNAGGECEVLGVTFDKLPKPRIGQIVDGSKIIDEEFAKIEKAAYEVLASDFRKKVDKLSKQEQKQ
jgi:hypothetical protein